ncbi:hypothetical protein [Paenibacillus xylanivorans]|uniref:Uncharacterized protein n=1 Tax=Paenibacillus xylanivorans TaxID=1705561 RepID=A0A0M9BT14_9BACL|nr:hypothetical protein [Paenibacillus xylanivorans]KOY17572.1 hypothetical protein AMS66_04745 [Paenibacillus xylanivorans]
MEGLSRRWLNAGSIDYSATMFGGKTIHWDFWSLFPYRFEESFLPTIMSVSHPVHTAMVALGLEMAVRGHRRLTNAIYALPALLFAWVILATPLITDSILCRTGL